MKKSNRGNGISNGLLLGSIFSSGGASDVVCPSGDTSWACVAKRFAAVIQTIIMVIFMFALLAWAYFHRKQIYKAIRN
jgi:hypothetical protein